MAAWRATLGQVPAAAVHTLAAGFGVALPAGGSAPVSIRANAVYRVPCQDSATGGAALRINHQALRGAPRFALAVAWQAWLARSGGGAEHLVAMPVRTRAGALVMRAGPWVASLQPWLPGEPLGREERDPAVYRQWGCALAQLHGAGQGFPALPVLPWYQWQHEAAAISGAVATRPELASAWRQVAQQLEKLSGRLVLAHGDQHAGNLLLDATGSVALIDFDEPMWGWPEMDLVRPMLEQLGQPVAVQQALAAALRSGWVAGGGAVDDDRLDLLLRFKGWNFLASRLAGDPGDGVPDTALLTRWVVTSAR